MTADELIDKLVGALREGKKHVTTACMSWHQTAAEALAAAEAYAKTAANTVIADEVAHTPTCIRLTTDGSACTCSARVFGVEHRARRAR